MKRSSPDSNDKTSLNIKKTDLVCEPTPVFQLLGLEGYLRYKTIWIKDDSRSGTLCGGSKVRKMEWFIAEAKARNISCIATFGGIASNHATAVALYGNLYGISSKLYLSKHVIYDKNSALKNIAAAHLSGAEITITSLPSRLLIEKACLLRKKLSLSPDVLYLPPGGFSMSGHLGYYTAALELVAQIRSGQLPKPSRLFVPVGSGGAIVGLWVGFSHAGLPINMVGVNIARTSPSKARITQESARLISFMLRKNYVNTSFNLLGDVFLTSRFLGSGYAHPTQAGLSAVCTLKDTDNIYLDETYTGKTMAALLEYAKNTSQDQEPILFWNTTGAVNILDQFGVDLDHAELMKIIPPRLALKLQRLST